MKKLGARRRGAAGQVRRRRQAAACGGAVHCGAGQLAGGRTGWLPHLIKPVVGLRARGRGEGTRVKRLGDSPNHPGAHARMRLPGTPGAASGAGTH